MSTIKILDELEKYTKVLLALENYTCQEVFNLIHGYCFFPCLMLEHEILEHKILFKRAISAKDIWCNPRMENIIDNHETDWILKNLSKSVYLLISEKEVLRRIDEYWVYSFCDLKIGDEDNTRNFHIYDTNLLNVLFNRMALDKKCIPLECILDFLMESEDAHFKILHTHRGDRCDSYEVFTSKFDKIGEVWQNDLKSNLGEASYLMRDFYALKSHKLTGCITTIKKQEVIFFKNYRGKLLKCKLIPKSYHIEVKKTFKKHVKKTFDLFFNLQ